ncbi:ABC-three component system middle component 2 [Rhodopseudomonas faecalis]|uniref:ABC-three component system middle component 2 n=1 Tax=Rhodopseudomonas faecalis TaxID=99655 RepID=UPI000DA21EE1|nr:ABC-three component system middle component 2 [Rhodopseudomonas faecalis]
MKSSTQADLFNGVLETGMRALVILNAFRSIDLDRDELGLLDYFVVHTSQAGGPSDIHPTGPSSFSEYHIRRRRIDDGIQLLQRIRLIEVVADHERGIVFRAGDDAPAFVDLLRTTYNRELVKRSEWLREQCAENSSFLKGLRCLIERWSIEFQEREAPGASE